MKVLKTIVATAVIVFAMTTVAMAGGQQPTKARDAQAVDKAPAQHAVALRDKQLDPRMDHRSGSHVRAAQRTKTRADRIHREHAQAQQGAHEAEAQHPAHINKSAQNEQSDHTGSTSTPGAHENETSHQAQVSTGGHVSGHGGGHVGH